MSEVQPNQTLSLYEKIIKLYPEITQDDFRLDKNAHVLLKDDGEGVYIWKWNHPSFPKPTQEQLDAVV